MKSKASLALTLLIFSTTASAGFSSQKLADPVTVNRIFQGNGTVYVTFSGTTLNGCSNNGGYLQPSWAEANGGVVNDAATNRMLSILLSSKALNSTMEIRYTNNDAGTGWNNCAITGIYLH